jgi:hypothetical protein
MTLRIVTPSNDAIGTVRPVSRRLLRWSLLKSMVQPLLSIAGAVDPGRSTARTMASVAFATVGIRTLQNRCRRCRLLPIEEPAGRTIETVRQAQKGLSANCVYSTGVLEQDLNLQHMVF